MRKSKTFCTLLTLIICLNLFSEFSNAQVPYARRAVMGNGGVSKSFLVNGNSYFMQQSIGQNGITGTISSNNLSLIQGFIQPSIVNNQLSNPSELEIKVKTLPNTDIYEITVEEEYTGALYLSLYNILGKKVYSAEIENTSVFNIDLSHYNTGYYILNIYSNKKQISTKLFKN